MSQDRASSSIPNSPGLIRTPSGYSPSLHRGITATSFRYYVGRGSLAIIKKKPICGEKGAYEQRQPRPHRPGAVHGEG